MFNILFDKRKKKLRFYINLKNTYLSTSADYRIVIRRPFSHTILPFAYRVGRFRCVAWIRRKYLLGATDRMSFKQPREAGIDFAARIEISLLISA